ncbi:MAG: glycosyltransferase family 4 protein [Halobacteriota archaeon]
MYGTHDAQRDKGAKVKITFVLPGYCDRPIGGYKVVYEYANRLVRNGHKATIVYLEDPRWYSSQRFPPALFSWAERHSARRTYARVKPAIRWYPLHEDVTLVRAVGLDPRRIPRADAIFATGWQTASSVNKCARDKGKKFYLIQHYEGLFLGDTALVDQTLRYPMTKIAVSSWLKRLLHERLGVDSELVINPIDTDVFYPTRTACNTNPRICMLNHELEWKGTRDGIEAFYLAQQECPDIYPVMFGPDTPRAAIDCEYHVRPTDEELRQIYNSCDIFLCASWAEGFGLTSAEALACRCCLVSTDTGGNSDYAIDGETALLSPPKDPSRLAENLVRVLKDRALLRNLADTGFERARGFTWEGAVRKMESIIARHL